MHNKQSHWQNVYVTKSSQNLSWYEPSPRVSLEMIVQTNLSTGAAIIDVGAGASTLVDHVLPRHRVTVLDISSAALAVSQQRLGADAARVTWLDADITEVNLPAQHFDLWHDRAVFHFLTDPSDRKRYTATLRHTLKTGGFLVLATFAPDGPAKCSGLDVVRYDAQTMQAALGAGFVLLESRPETHVTPSGNEQKFVYGLFGFRA